MRQTLVHPPWRADAHRAQVLTDEPSVASAAAMIASVATILPIGGITPQRPRFLAPNATLIGDVRFAAGCSVWFGAILRGDINHISLGERANVQDACVLHVSKRLPCLIGERTSLGHGVIAHACSVGNDCLLGMGSRILDGAEIGDGCLVAAGCVVPEGLVVPPGHLIAGVPGRVVKALKPELRTRMERISQDYAGAYQELYPQLIVEADEQA